MFLVVALLIFLNLDQICRLIDKVLPRYYYLYLVYLAFDFSSIGPDYL